MENKPCKVRWCTALSVAGDDYCIIHLKAVSLRDGLTPSQARAAERKQQALYWAEARQRAEREKKAALEARAKEETRKRSEAPWRSR